MADYHDSEIEFRYPDGWELIQDEVDGDPSVTVQRDGAFWTATILKSRPAVEDVLSQATDAFREEYDELDVYESQAPLCGEKHPFREIEFFAVDLVNRVWLRALRNGRFTLFIMAQATDHECEELSPIFDAITASLAIVSDDDKLIN
ncbi:MAG: hypothetical protein KDA80_15165 [Planctomycetaceae bacterium]|nr:hypothetical protein [Planctomycetaceae bacterium]